MNQQVNTHVKVQYNTEFRRFGIQSQTTFTELERTLRDLFSIEQTCEIVIKFVDDEKDLVLISSDVELHHALTLMSPLLRLSLETSSSSPSPCAVPACGKVEEGYSCRRGEDRPFRGPRRGGFGGFHGGHGCRGGRGRGPRDHEDNFQRTTERLTSRIQQLETCLKQDQLPANRARAIRWRIEKLEQKLEDVQKMKDAVTEPSSPVTVTAPTSETAPPRGCHGHGCRGGRGRGGRGRGACHAKIDDVFEQNVQSCRKNLMAARETGDQAEIKKARLLFQEAKFQMKEERFKARSGSGSVPPFVELKIRKHRAMKNLRDARPPAMLRK